jgi:hypothetical protein
MKRQYAIAAAVCVMFFSAGVALRTPGASPRPAGTVVEQDSAGREQNAQMIERALGELRAKIAGREKEPAGDVFKNIQLNKSMEAGRLPGMMGFWSNALGVTCKHCHIVDQWEKEDRPEKQIARDMVAMVGTINTDILKKIKNLDSPEPRIGCWTCHRGKVIPEFFPPREKKN